MRCLLDAVTNKIIQLLFKQGVKNGERGKS